MQPNFQTSLQRAERVLFLCSGNMIRSAFSELYARHLGVAWPVESAATTYRNDRIHGIAARALRARGVSESWISAFRPRHVDQLGSVSQDTLVLGMTREHLDDWSGLGPPAWLLSEVAGRQVEIEDPMFTGRSEILDDVADYVERLCAHEVDR